MHKEKNLPTDFIYGPKCNNLHLGSPGGGGGGEGLINR